MVAGEENTAFFFFLLLLSMKLNYALNLMNGDGISNGLALWSALLILLAGLELP